MVEESVDRFIAAAADAYRSTGNARATTVADILVGHVSSGLCHLANISYRLGRDEAFDPRTGAVAGNAAATETLARMEEHLKDNNVRLDASRLRVGKKLEWDAATERFKNDAAANALLTRAYRAPFVVPDRVA